MFLNALNEPVELTDIERTIWEQLEAANQPGHSWRLPVFGSQNNLRTIVLRAASAKDRSLTFFTDVRSAKVSQLRVECNSAPNTCVLFYSHEHKVQLRVDGVSELHTEDAIADHCWAECPPASRLAYLTDESPGQPSSQPVFSPPPQFEPTKLTAEDLKTARTRFCVIRTFVHSMDWLQLSSGGNLRAQFLYDTDSPRASWLVP